MYIEKIQTLLSELNRTLKIGEEGLLKVADGYEAPGSEEDKKTREELIEVLKKQANESLTAFSESLLLATSALAELYQTELYLTLLVAPTDEEKYSGGNNPVNVN